MPNRKNSPHPRTREVGAVITGLALTAGLMGAGFAPAAASGSASPPAWQSQTLQSLGMQVDTLYVVVTQMFHGEDLASATADGIAGSHIVFSDQLSAIPAHSDVVVLGGTAAMPPSISRTLTANGDTVVQLGGASHLQTQNMLDHFTEGDPLGAIALLANQGPDSGTGWIAAGDPYAGQGAVYSNGSGEDGVSLYQPYAFGAPPSSWTVDLSAAPTSLLEGSATKLTATANTAVGPATGTTVNIIDETTGRVIQTCTSGTTCTASVTEATATTQTFMADIGPAGALAKANGVQAASNAVEVVWYFIGGGGIPPVPPAVTLSANPTNLMVAQGTALTASGTSLSAGDTLTITGTPDGLDATSPSLTTTSAVYSTTDAVYNPAGETVLYTAHVLSPGGQDLANSTPVSVTWNPWTVSIPNPPAFQPMASYPTWSVTAVTPDSVTGLGYAITIEDTTTGQILGSCSTGTSCTQYYVWQPQDAFTQTFQAFIGLPGSNVTTTSDLAVSAPVLFNLPL